MIELNPSKQSVEIQPPDVNDCVAVDILDTKKSGQPYQELNLPNPYSEEGPSIIHPSVIYDGRGIFGFQYWMVYTPYPNSDSQYENPCIAVSNDGLYWSEHPRSSNPIISRPSAGYNSDPFIFRHPDGTKLYICYRERYTNNRIYIIESEDGFHWSQPKLILSRPVSTSDDIASCSVYFDHAAGVWAMVSHNVDLVSTKPLRRHVSSTEDIYSAWALAGDITVESPGSGRLWWHSEFRRTVDGRFIGILMDNPSGSLGAPGRLFLAESLDGMLTVEVRLVAPGSLHYKSGFSVLPTGELVLWKAVTRAGSYRIQREVYVAGFAEAAITKVFEKYNVAGSWPSELIHLDRYNRADGAVGSPDVGVAMAVSSGSFSIASSRLSTTGASSNMATIAMPGGDYVVGCSCLSRAIDLYIVFRGVDSANYIRVGFNTAGLAVVQKIVAGNFGALNETIYPDVNGGLPVDLRVVCLGKRFSLYFNGVLYKTYEDSVAFTTGIKVGVSGGGAGNVFDNFIAIAL